MSEKGVFVDGSAASGDAAVHTCKQTRGAWPSLRVRLEREHVKIYMRGVIDDGAHWLQNPLANGCD